MLTSVCLFKCYWDFSPREITPTDANQHLKDPLIKSPAVTSAETSLSDVPVTVEQSEGPLSKQQYPLCTISTIILTMSVSPYAISNTDTCIMPTDPTGSPTDPVAESPALTSVETSLAAVPMEPQEVEGTCMLPCASI